MGGKRDPAARSGKEAPDDGRAADDHPARRRSGRGAGVAAAASRRRGFWDGGQWGAAPGGEAGTGSPQTAQWLAQLEQMINGLASAAAPAARQVGAKEPSSPRSPPSRRGPPHSAPRRSRPTTASGSPSVPWPSPPSCVPPRRPPGPPRAPPSPRRAQPGPPIEHRRLRREPRRGPGRRYLTAAERPSRRPRPPGSGRSLAILGRP